MKKCLVCEKDYCSPDNKSKYCSRECYYKMKRIRRDRVRLTPEGRKKLSESQKGKNNSMYGKKQWNEGREMPQFWGENHPNWKSGSWINGYGYRVIQNKKDTNGEKILEHRLVMQKHLGRELESHEIVHHINGDKLDNSIENLEITNRADHIRMHLCN